MDAFDYTALEANGNKTNGVIMATSARDARSNLRAKNLIPIKIGQAKTSKKRFGQTKGQEQSHASDKSNDGLVTGQGKFSGRIPHKELTRAMRQLAILIRSDTQVEQALKITAMQFKSGLRPCLLEVRSRIIEGQKLSEGMARHPKVFPPLFVAMISAGEVTGHVDRVLERIATDMEAAQKIRRTILAATIYPIVLCVVALLVIVILMVVVVPKVVDQFDSFGQELPALTQFVIGLSHWIKAYGVWAALMVIVGIGLFTLSLKNPVFRKRFDQFVLAIPFIGTLIRAQNTARFARTAAGLMDAGTPALHALQVASATLKNKVMRSATEKACDKIREGDRVGRSLGASNVFPDILTHMVSGGEASGDLGRMFSLAADYLEGELDSAITVFLSLLEPMIIILLAGFVLLIIAAIFLPILQLNTLVF